MLSTLANSSSLPVLEQVVNFTEARHGVLAGNIANLDTPGYQTRDLSPELFEQRLKQAIESSQSKPTERYGSIRGSSGGSSPQQMNRDYDAFREVSASLKDIMYHDGSDVSLEQQVNELVKNNQQHSLAVSIMTSQFRLLRAAITESVV